MEKKDTKINVRSETLHSILFLPDTINHKSITNNIFPLVIRVNGMPGKSPEEDGQRFAHYFVDNNIAYFTYDHQGVRTSTGIFSYYDAQANIEKVIDQLVQYPNINPLKIGLLGESFGGAMALCHTVRDKRVKCLAIRSPVFDTEIVPKNPLFKFFIRALTRNKEMRFPEVDFKEEYSKQTKQFNPKRLAKHLTKPFYLIAGNKDALFPEKGFHQLFNKVKSKEKKIEILDGANHNFTDKNHFQQMCKKIKDFFQFHLVSNNINH
ncbi:MAG: alpha/beta hydrolase family protein [Promethearchaeota archaeon]|jgi:dipeptidyl aminopeptidase/acylaminoacyl peptidase